MLELTIVDYFDKHPIQKVLATWWIRKGLPIPEKIKRQIINQIHVEMIVRLMDIVVKHGSMTLDDALSVHYEIGKEMAEQTRDILSLDTDSAADLSKIIDFLHGLLDIKGKRTRKSGREEAISHWYSCPLAERLRESAKGGGPYYCHLYQEMYKGLLHGINPKAMANNLDTTQSQGHEFCELRTWLQQAPNARSSEGIH